MVGRGSGRRLEGEELGRMEQHLREEKKKEVKNSSNIERLIGQIFVLFHSSTFGI